MATLTVARPCHCVKKLEIPVSEEWSTREEAEDAADRYLEILQNGRCGAHAFWLERTDDHTLVIKSRFDADGFP